VATSRHFTLNDPQLASQLRVVARELEARRAQLTEQEFTDNSRAARHALWSTDAEEYGLVRVTTFLISPRRLPLASRWSRGIAGTASVLDAARASLPQVEGRRPYLHAPQP
jgi:hypothetical protein